MIVRAEFYSRLRELVGSNSLEIVLGEGATVYDMREQLCGVYPKLRDFKKSMLFGIGVEFVNLEQPLRNGEVVAIMPPVQGG